MKPDSFFRTIKMLEDVFGIKPEIYTTDTFTTIRFNINKHLYCNVSLLSVDPQNPVCEFSGQTGTFTFNLWDNPQKNVNFIKEKMYAN